MKQRVAILSAIFTIFLFFLPLVTHNAHAAVINDQSSFDAAMQKGESGLLNLEVYGGHITVNPMWMIGELILGCTYCNKSSSLHYSKSAIAGIGNYMAAMYDNPPADTKAFVQDMGQSLGFIPRQAYAQGVGFSGLAPLLGLWKAFRNIAYILLAFVMIIIGFMVMFRKKIDPKTVVTVQNALPGIIVILLLITFSYAIVGLLIDLMYLIILLALAVIGNSGIQGINVAQLQTTYTTGGLNELIGGIFSPLSVLGINPTAAVTAIGATIIGGAINPLAGLAIGGLTYAVAAVGSGNAFSPLLFLIFALALIFGFIRIFFMLVSAYIQIIMAVIFGPIQILIGALPGSNGVTAWFNNLIVNLITFPITVIMLAVGGVIAQNIGSQPLWTPPLLPGATGDLIRGIIGLGVVMVIPSIVNGIKESLKAKPAVPAGLGVILGPMGAGLGQTLQLGYQASFVTSAIGKIHVSNPFARQKKAAETGAPPSPTSP